MSADDLIIGDDFAQTFGPTDTDRASWALSAIKTYAAWTRQSLEGQPIAGSTAEELIVDLLGDLRRLIDTLGLRADCDQLSERGQPRYSANRPDEAPPAPDDATARGGRRDLATGTRVQLISCKDRHAYVQPRTLGTVSFVDDAHIVHVNWDGGGTLGLRPSVDRFEAIGESR